MKTNSDPKAMKHSKSSSKRKVDSDTDFLWEEEKSQTTLHLKQLEKEQQTKSKVSRRKEKIKIRAEVSEIKTKITETESWFFEKIKQT